jgi:hypothetical protein
MIGLDPSQILEGGFNPEIAMSARSFDGPLARSPAGSTKSDPVSARQSKDTDAHHRRRKRPTCSGGRKELARAARTPAASRSRVGR